MKWSLIIAELIWLEKFMLFIDAILITYNLNHIFNKLRTEVLPLQQTIYCFQISVCFQSENILLLYLIWNHFNFSWLVIIEQLRNKDTLRNQIFWRNWLVKASNNRMMGLWHVMYEYCRRLLELVRYEIFISGKWLFYSYLQSIKKCK